MGFEINKVYNEDCLETMKRMEDGFIDLTVTSPPYDFLRDYKGYSFDFENIAKQLYRVTKDGGVVVWVVGDATVDGSETGTSFKQALFFKEVGFNLHDTMIYEKNGSPYPASRKGNRYTQIFEYMFIFSRGAPKTANLICDKRNSCSGITRWGKFSTREKDGTLKRKDIKKFVIPDYSPRTNIWKYDVGHEMGTRDKIAYKHPAQFPEALARDHILSWSNEGDLIYDPMLGSGTTAKVAKLLNRDWVGSEISSEYCEIIKKRLENYVPIF